MKNYFLILLVFVGFNSYSQTCGAFFSHSTSGLAVNFNDSSFANSQNFTSFWNFGDSTTSTQRSPLHNYSTSGSYYVCLTIQDTVCSDTYCDTVTVSANCQADFSYFIDSNNVVSFYNRSITPPNVQYIWDFGDSSAIDTSANPNHFYLSSGSYIVSLTLNGGGTSCSTTDTIYVNNCNAQFSTQVDSTGTAIFTNTSIAAQFTNYFWDFGDSSTSMQKSPTHTYLNSGNYIVTLSLYDSLSNCSSSATDSIVVFLPSPCNAGFTSRINQDSLFITNSATNYTSVNYQFGDGDSSTVENPIHIYDQSGTFIVCQTVRDSLSNCSSSYCDTISISVPPKCEANFAFSTNNDTAFFINLATNFTSLNYKFGDGDSSNLEDPFHIYDQSGTYAVCQMVLDSATNCFDTFCDSVTINILPSCSAGFTYSISGDSVYFTSTAEAETRRSYDFGDGDSSTLENPVHSYNQSGTYLVNQKVFNDSTNCTDVFVDTITVTINQACNAKYEIAIDTTKKSKLFLINTSTNESTHTYFWTFGDGENASGRTPTHTYENFGAYKICLNITDSILQCNSTYCDSVGLDSNGNVLKTNGFVLQVIEGMFIGIEEAKILEKTIVFPNPFSAVLTIELPKTIEQVEFEIIDLSGKEQLRGTLKSTRQQLDLHKLQKGVYFIRMINNNQTIIRKIIKG